MINRKYFVLLVIFSFLGVLSVFKDPEILNFFISYRAPFLDRLMVSLSSGVTVFLILIFLPAILFWSMGNVRMCIPLIISAGISLLLAFALKGIFARPHPIVPALVLTSGNSFPSTHAAFAFSVVPIVSKSAPRLKWIWIAFAFLISFSRLYVGVNYLSDVIFGGILGIVIGTSLILWGSDWWKKLR